jgi:cytochrome P450 PksS
MIGSGSLALLEHPAQLQKLRSEPELIKPAIEELLRFVCPVEMATERYNKHLAFGQGEHYCLGASLARLEGQIAINTLVQRAPNLHLSIASEQIRWRGGFILRGLEALPVSFE